MLNAEGGLKKSEEYFFKKTQAAPLHERGPAALSNKNLVKLGNPPPLAVVMNLGLCRMLKFDA
jgi:hypothetical protein